MSGLGSRVKGHGVKVKCHQGHGSKVRGSKVMGPKVTVPRVKLHGGQGSTVTGQGSKV